MPEAHTLPVFWVGFVFNVNRNAIMSTRDSQSRLSLPRFASFRGIGRKKSSQVTTYACMDDSESSHGPAVAQEQPMPLLRRGVSKSHLDIDEDEELSFAASSSLSKPRSSKPPRALPRQLSASGLALFNDHSNSHDNATHQQSRRSSSGGAMPSSPITTQSRRSSAGKAGKQHRGQLQQRPGSLRRSVSSRGLVVSESNEEDRGLQLDKGGRKHREQLQQRPGSLHRSRSSRGLVVSESNEEGRGLQLDLVSVTEDKSKEEGTEPTTPSLENTDVDDHDNSTLDGSDNSENEENKMESHAQFSPGAAKAVEGSAVMDVSGSPSTRSRRRKHSAKGSPGGGGRGGGDEEDGNRSSAQDSMFQRCRSTSQVGSSRRALMSKGKPVSRGSAAATAGLSQRGLMRSDSTVVSRKGGKRLARSVQ